MVAFVADLDALQDEIENGEELTCGTEAKVLALIAEIRFLRPRIRNPNVTPWPLMVKPLCECGGSPVHTVVRHVDWKRGTDFQGAPQ